MNPLEIFYCWQTLAMASVIVGLTQSFKAGIEAFLTYRNVNAQRGGPGVVLSGKELRAQVKMLDNVLLPLFPLMAGACLAAMVPIRPDVLTQYVSQVAPGSHSAFALWGAAVGQFADYIFTKAKRAMSPNQPPSSPRGSDPPSSSSESVTPTPPPPSPAATEPKTPPPSDEPASGAPSGGSSDT